MLVGLRRILNGSAQYVTLDSLDPDGVEFIAPDDKDEDVRLRYPTDVT